MDEIIELSKNKDGSLKHGVYYWKSLCNTSIFETHTYQHGLLHSLNDEPSFINHINGDMMWSKNGKKHRDNDLPAIISYNGKRKMWFINGILHRINGPAIEYENDYEEEWYLDGLKHRENGPAVTSLSGEKQWWIYGVQYTEEQFNIFLKNKLHQSLELELLNKQKTLLHKI